VEQLLKVLHMFLHGVVIDQNVIGDNDYVFGP
jgi:hypothetical protein